MLRRRFMGGASSIDVENYLTIVALEDGLTAKLSMNTCQYCIDGNGVWLSISAGTTTQSIKKGQTLSFKGTLTPSSSSSSYGIGTFTINKSFELTGNCMSMIFGDDADSNLSLSGKNYAFYNLFKNCTTLKYVSDNFLPATTLSTNCYRYMFQGCTSLVNTPELPATTLANYCYEHMFYGCSNLTVIPAELPATTLASYCYQYMFSNCSSLVNTPELPATTLASYCYCRMFSGCTSLKNTSKLPATTLKSYCYQYMFYGCTSLVRAPELPAETLTTICYLGMFSGCSNLNYIRMLAKTATTSYLNSWVSNVAPTGTFVKNVSATWDITGASGVPTGWVIKYTSFRQDNYLTIEALEDGLQAKLSVNSCQYCIDGGDWKTLNAGSYTTSINKGQTLCFKGNLTPNSTNGIGTFSVNKSFNLSGNCMSMLFGDNANTNKSLSGKNYAFYNLFKNCTTLKSVSDTFLPATTLSEFCYDSMFWGCTSLTTAPKLPARTLAKYCYEGMFGECTSLTTAPKLPAETLAEGCYYRMFKECSSLTDAPKLPATTLSPTSPLKQNGCYESMFYGCSSLINAPSTLPAKTLYDYCYASMFFGCSLLKTAPKLPATTLAEGCYYQMFKECSSLTSAPELPATTLCGPTDADYTEGQDSPYGCYQEMFEECISLKKAPELPATTLAAECYMYMFSGCTSLVTPPSKLPATTLAEACYADMFLNCESLTTAPELPAETLARICYSGMFQGCSSLTKAPILPAEILVEGCYHQMFSGCINLNYIKMLATDIEAYNCLNDWVRHVASTGTFVKNRNAIWDETGDSGVPNGWTLKSVLNIKNYLTIEVLDDNTYIGNSDSYTSYDYFVNGHIDKNDNETGWVNCLRGERINIAFNAGDKISFRQTVIDETNDYYEGFAGTFEVSGPFLDEWGHLLDYNDKMFNVTGNCMSMLFGDNANTNNSLANLSYAFSALFKNCTKLKSVSKNFLPATTLSKFCYYHMFDGCSSLTTAPELPATTLAEGCYYGMFDSCLSLTTAPELPATTLAYRCYMDMFDTCISLTTPPRILPATTLAEACYCYMFMECSSLSVAPELPATTLATDCYFQMFIHCNQLNYIKMLATNISASECLKNWVTGVSSSGEFVKNKNANIPSGDHGIPNGWTVRDAYNTPSIINTLYNGVTTVTFTYEGGVISPTAQNTVLSSLTTSQLLSLKPSCNIKADIIIPDINNNVREKVHTDYIWTTSYKLSEILKKIYGMDYDKENVAKRTAIIIKVLNVSDPGDGYGYGYDSAAPTND